MSAAELLVRWVFPIVAIVYVLGYSSLFAPVRKWRRLPAILSALLDCPMCIGFWAGIGVGALQVLPIEWPVWAAPIGIGGCTGIACQYILELARKRRT
jgi:hypothetical protein